MTCMNNENFIKKFGLFSIIVAIIYFILETWFTVKFGQSAIQLIADYIAVSLLIFGGIVVRKNAAGVGLLCGAWGYNFCINYRAFAWRMEAIWENNSTLLIDNTAKVLAATLVFSAIAFVVSLVLCYPTKNAKF